MSQYPSTRSWSPWCWARFGSGQNPHKRKPGLESSATPGLSLSRSECCQHVRRCWLYGQADDRAGVAKPVRREKQWQDVWVGFATLRTVSAVTEIVPRRIANVDYVQLFQFCTSAPVFPHVLSGVGVSYPLNSLSRCASWWLELLGQITCLNNDYAEQSLIEFADSCNAARPPPTLTTSHWFDILKYFKSTNFNFWPVLAESMVLKCVRFGSHRE